MGLVRSGLVQSMLVQKSYSRFMVEVDKMFKVRAVWQDIVSTSRFIGVTLIIFAVSIYMGMTNDGFSNFLNMQLSAIKELSETLDQSSNPTFTIFIFIFLNNAIKSVLTMFLGAFFGVYPIFFIAVNGLVIGFIVKLTLDGTMTYSLFDLIFKLLLPHGILEIPVLIIVTAYGLRLGKLLFNTLGALMFNHDKLDTVGKNYVQTLKRCGVMAVYATILLFVAAIIESTFTAWLATTIK